MKKDIDLIYKAIGLAYKNNDILKVLKLQEIKLVLLETYINIKYIKEKDAWLTMNEIFINNYDVPQLPKPLRQFHIQALIRCGAIAKKDLVINQKYYGRCRVGDTAIWNGDKFQVFDYKGNMTEQLFHFEDDDGFALFTPIKKIV